MCGPSLSKLGDLELLIGNEKVSYEPTDGQTDRVNRHVQSNMPSLLRRGTHKDDLNKGN